MRTSCASVPGLPTARTWICEAERVEAILQVENDLAAFDPEQMLPCARGIAVHKSDGEDIDMPRRDLERVAAVIEQFWVTAIERDMARRTGVRFLIGRRLGLLEQGFGHSCATSLA